MVGRTSARRRNQPQARARGKRAVAGQGPPYRRIGTGEGGDFNGAPGKIRTPDPQIRSLVLYPAELPVPGPAREAEMRAVWDTHRETEPGINRIGRGNARPS